MGSLFWPQVQATFSRPASSSKKRWYFYPSLFPPNMWSRIQKRKGHEGPPQNLNRILPVLWSQCLPWCFFCDKPSINFCCLELRQWDTHKGIELLTAIIGWRLFFNRSKWFLKLSSLSEATRKQALVSRRELCLCASLWLQYQGVISQGSCQTAWQQF